MKKLFTILLISLFSLVNTALGMGFMGKPLKAKEYFEGQQLVIAEGISGGDLRALYATDDLELLSREGKKELSLMWFAADTARPNFEAIKVLVEKGVDPTTQALHPFGPMLYYSLKSSDLRYLTALLDGGFSVNYQDDNNSPLIQLAAGPHGSLDHVKLVLKRGGDISLRDRLGDDALNAALDSDNTDIAKYLIEQGANVHNINHNGVTTVRSVDLTLNRANSGTQFYQEFEEIRKMMIQRGVEFPSKHPKEVKEWMRSKDMYIIGE